MKVLILAGGWGTRLGKQTEVIPKPMVQIGGKPILFHIMKNYAHYGHRNFIISCGVKSEVIKSYFLNYRMHNSDFTVDTKNNNIDYHNSGNLENWNVTIADTGINTLKGARIKRVEKYLDEEVNMLTYGDGLSDIDINQLIAFHKSHGKILTISGVRPPARFGELIEKRGKLVSFSEKPQTSTGLINGGYMVFNKKLLDYLSSDENCDFEYGPIDKLTSLEQVMVYKHEGNWECMDHERDVIHLNDLWNEGKYFWKD